MKFKIHKKSPHKNAKGSDAEHAKKFSSMMIHEMPDLVKAVVLFGSTARNDASLHDPDIDVLVIVDDLTIILSKEVIEAYRVITERTAARISNRLHINTMKLTNFWEYVRNGDPIAINMLRDGISLYDSGFFEPTQQLLFSGRIKPTRESIHHYFARAPLTLHNADWHVMQASMDLYWAVIDAAHAILMKFGEIPPSPKHMAKLLNTTLVKKKKLHAKHVNTMSFFFDLNKDITHRNIKKITGKQYDTYKLRAEEFVNAIQRLLNE